jgi:lipid A ethanolaminephosphotransferase
MNDRFSRLQPPSGWSKMLRRPWRWRPEAIGFVVLFSLGNLALYHLPLYSFAVANLDPYTWNGVMTVVTLLVAVFVVTSVVLLLASMVSRRLLLYLSMLIALGNSVALYFVVTYQAVLDKTMMGNVFNTDWAEALSYLHPKLLVYVLVFGVVPCVLLMKVRIRPVQIWRTGLAALVTLVAGVGWAYASSSTWLWIDQNAKKLGGMVMPWSYLANAVRYQSTQLEEADPILLPPATFSSDGRTVVVLVIGEAARAQNFSLYGYDRPTNPNLAEWGVVALANTESCATYTTAALGCILSPAASDPERYEALPSYLYRYGVDVIWRANNWGEPALRVASYERAPELRAACEGPGCQHDEVLLTGLAERIRTSDSQRIFVVLHLRGSHGPAYHSEYPPRFGAFTPVCESVELSECSDEELENAYDNTIVYTDYVLSRVIGLLNDLEDTPAVFLYLSDHGESLGEYGLYLHGTPLSIAPDVQKSIPFLVWMSRAFMQREGVSRAQLEQQGRHSQSNVFHSVMGAFDMHSEAYEPRLDIFATASGGRAE